ncbi:hypothetical protein KY285_016865 [Solanum tuberosum]|nr:hypothetical protein KY285_016865 [Solanum tuberosum]
MVSWEFVEEALIGYGFPIGFVKLVMICVTCPKYSVMVNGIGYGYFEGKRGLRQGDPMSPLLFVLGMEYLSRVLKVMSASPNFKFHPMCKNLKLTHLVFADDLMIFCSGKEQSVRRVMEALDHFTRVTGMIENMDKSNMFIAGTDEQTNALLLSITGFTVGTFPIRYLGLSLSSKKWSKLECQQLSAKITHRIKNGYAKMLSYAGRLKIIIAVLFSIHSFWGAVFVLLQSVLKEVDRLCREYLWGNYQDKRSITLVSWEKLCIPKQYGGLNIKGCRIWNIASVGKLL